MEPLEKRLIYYEASTQFCNNTGCRDIDAFFDKIPELRLLGVHKGEQKSDETRYYIRTTEKQHTTVKVEKKADKIGIEVFGTDLGINQTHTIIAANFTRKYRNQ